MEHLTVTQDPDGRSGLESIAIEDIYYLVGDSKNKRVMAYVDHNKKYYLMGPLVYWATAIANSGNYKFFKLDRNTIINIDKIEVLDTNYRMAYFNKDKKFGCEVVGYKITDYTDILSQINKKIVII